MIMIEKDADQMKEFKKEIDQFEENNENIHEEQNEEENEQNYPEQEFEKREIEINSFGSSFNHSQTKILDQT